MDTRNRLAAWLVFGLCLLGVLPPPTLDAAQTATKPAAEQPAANASPAVTEEKCLRDAFQSAGGNPQVIITNLEGFLARFPQSARRELVLRTICHEATVANVPDVTIKYGRMLLETTPDDPTLLSLLMDALDRQRDPASRTLAIEYSTRLIASGEKQREQASSPQAAQKGSPDPWAQGLGTLYARRAGYYRDSGVLEKASADFEKSYVLNPTARTAEQLGDVASAQGNTSRAVECYLTAFAFPENDADLTHRRELRRKLGSAYLAVHHSSSGLGDMVLARTDELMQQFSTPFSTGRSENADRSDPFEFVLERPEGPPLHMADYRGKVLVVDFWATWCGPCRVAGKLFEQVMEHFQAEPGAAFLAVNVDEDPSIVPGFLKTEGWKAPVVYGRGLDHLLRVVGLPTVMIFDRQGRVVYRQEGVPAQGFTEVLDQHLRAALQETVSSRQ